MKSPRLMLVFRKKISVDAHKSICDAITRAEADDRHLVIEEADVYQLVDGRWQPLNPDAASPSRGTAATSDHVDVTNLGDGARRYADHLGTHENPPRPL